MITPTFIKNYKTSDGTVFKTVEEAQHREIEILFHGSNSSTEPISVFVMKNKDAIVDILTIPLIMDKIKPKVSHKKKEIKIAASTPLAVSSPVPLTAPDDNIVSGTR